MKYIYILLYPSILILIFCTSLRPATKSKIGKGNLYIKFKPNIKLNKYLFEDSTITGISYDNYSTCFNKYLKLLPNKKDVIEQSEEEAIKISKRLKVHKIRLKNIIQFTYIDTLYSHILPLRLSEGVCFQNSPNFNNYFQTDEPLLPDLPQVHILVDELCCITNVSSTISPITTLPFPEGGPVILGSSNMPYCSVEIVWFSENERGHSAKMSSSSIEKICLSDTPESERTELKNQTFLYSNKLNLGHYWENSFSSDLNKIGDSVKLVHIDQSWGGLYHEKENITLPIPFGYQFNDSHGLEMLGITKSKIDIKNCSIAGLAPSTNISLISTNQQYGVLGAIDGYYDIRMATFIALLEALKSDKKSKIIGFSVGSGSDGRTPIESDPLVFDLIHFATHCLKIVVVESAGNENNDLDYLDYPSDIIKFRLSRKASSFYDSGAIIVGATCNPNTFTVANFFSNRRYKENDELGSNFGSRVDCFIWGENIPTTTIQNKYTYQKHTSGSSAIIMGIAITLQDYSIKKYGKILTPFEMRTILTNNLEAQNPNCDYLYICNFISYLRYNVFSFRQPNYVDLITKVDDLNPTSLPLY